MRYFQDFGETANTYSIICLSGADGGFLFGVNSSVSIKSFTEPCLLGREVKELIRGCSS